MKPLEWTGGKLRFLDQTKLPAEEVWIETDDVYVVDDAIRRLALRGAPLIGIAAAYGAVLAAQRIPRRGILACKTSFRYHTHARAITSDCNQSFLGAESTA